MTKFIMKYIVMLRFSTQLRDARIAMALKKNQVSSETGIDATLISRFESGTRLPTKKQLQVLAAFYSMSIYDLRTMWLSEKILDIVDGYEEAYDAVHVAESRIEYLTKIKKEEDVKLSEDIRSSLIRLDELKTIWKRCQPTQISHSGKLIEYFNVSYTYESNRIEGNTLTLQETQLVIKEGLTISGKSVTEHLEAINHAYAIDFLLSIIANKESLTRRSLLDLHRLILSGIDHDNAGRYRSGPVRISGSRHIPPQPYLIDKLMEDYFLHYSSIKDVMHPVLVAAEMHERLVSIHPFIDGNGRTSRLVMNMILLSNGFTIANIKGDNESRLRYYTSLEKVQTDNEPEHFYRLIADTVEKSLMEHIELAGGKV